MITAYFTKINNVPDEAFSKLLFKTESNISERIRAYVGRDQQLARVCGRALLYELLCHYDLEKTYLIANMKYDEYGRPYFSPEFDFNISHSGNIVICAGAKGGKTGIDLEKVEPRDIDIMREYFTAREWESIVLSEDSTAAFYKMWVRKEACLKAVGKGLIQPMNEVDASEAIVNINGADWFLHDLHIPGYAGCVATSTRNESISITEVDINTLVNQ